MAFETIRPGGDPSPSLDPPQPAAGTSSGANSSQPSAAAQHGVVDEATALSGADHAKMTTFTVSDMAKGPAGSAGAAGAPGSSVAMGGLVSGKVVVDLMDSLIPAALVLAFHRFGVSTRKSQYALTQGEKNTLAPIVEACLNSINLNFDSPWTTLMVSLAVIYGGKAAEVGGVAWIDKKTDEKTPAAPKTAPSAGPAKVIGGNFAPPPQPLKTPDSAFTDDFHPDGPTTWTEADVKAIMKRQKKGRPAAEEWLQKNWAKKGGQI